jgi:hypothetical protein
LGKSASSLEPAPLAKVSEYFNIDAFTYPTVGTLSPVGRNSFIGPAYIMTNMTVGRGFPLQGVREEMRVNIRVEGYNGPRSLPRFF